MSATAKPLMTQADFLAWEALQPQRHEFDRGVIRAMTGGTQAHDRVRMNIAAALHSQLRGKPCRASLDVRVACPNGNVRYPDVAVDCGPYDPKALSLADPRLVAEVLSPSTQGTDYIAKTEDYSSLPGIEISLIVSTDEPRVDVLRRVDGRLRLAETVEGLEGAIAAESLGVTLAMGEIFAAV
jgi:Uma2 family endonuclease